MAQAEVPGATLLRERLQRARALPEPRDPVVQAFIDSYELLDNVVAALPLGAPTPPDDQAGSATLGACVFSPP